MLKKATGRAYVRPRPCKADAPLQNDRKPAKHLPLSSNTSSDSPALSSIRSGHIFTVVADERCGGNPVHPLQVVQKRRFLAVKVDLRRQLDSRCIYCFDLITYFLTELETNREKYLPYEAKNGWGTVNGTIIFFAQILDDWANLVKWNEKLVPVVTFWIE